MKNIENKINKAFHNIDLPEFDNKKLNEKKVWNTDKLFSVNEFIERDKKRAMFDDFNNTEVSEVQKLYEEIIKE